MPTAPATDEIGGDSLFLRSGSTHKDSVALVFMTAGTRKDPSFGQLFAELRPLAGGYFEIEFGAILQERLAIAEGKPEYVVSLSRSTALNRRFSVSNVMQIARYRYQGENWHAIFPMQAWQQLYDARREELGTTPHVEFLPTVVAAVLKWWL